MVGLFMLTILLGWISGVFKALRRKPELKISTLPGPTFVCVFGTGNKRDGYDTHSTGIALYLRISNVEMSSTSITDVKVGYRLNMSVRNLRDFVRYRVRWFFLNEQSVSLSDFQVAIGENIKVYPFLIQKPFPYGEPSTTFLEPGRSTNGVVYFEQPESWGGYFPVSRHFKNKVKIVISDSFGKCYRCITNVDRLALKDARRYNPKFGTTFAELHGRTAPIELAVDKHGNVMPPKQ